MNNTLVKTRFAPSPTGLMHLGNLRTALFCALLARKHQGVFLLRIEDTDQSRSLPEYTEALARDLRWLGLDWQEGYDLGGDHGPYCQHDRMSVYDEYYRKLEDAGLVYPCFCSERELKMVRKAQLSAGQPPRYTGTCAQLKPEEIAAKREQGLQPTLRFRVPKGREIVFEDLVRGRQRFVSDDIGDFIIRRADGTPAFFFSNAVDDSLMGVSHVLRGEDHLTNTPRQLMLLEALGLSAPAYGHISMIVGPDGSPLSKRHGSRSVEALREAGYLPLALINYLARLGHYYADNDFFDIDGLASGFEFEHLGKAPARFDESQLLHWQREAVAAESGDRLWQWAEPALRVDIPTDKRQAFVETVRANAAFPEDMAVWADVAFGELPPVAADDLEPLQQAGGEFFAVAQRLYAEFGPNYGELTKGLKAQTGAKGKGLFLPLRLALTGRRHGPELGPLLALIPPPEVARRLASAEAQAAG
ncbi:glutamate--tRNA ligase [Alkalilimnicola ehrlichii]|uniref:glutamate--tRNA ligase n=1 Tax=Alkalilimnicola ehrlichii TaxID=351052 RepID=UPI000E2E67D3|nr:glutamate--tRNA ligase [Alkalilimnicola ehrlichii]RFA30873.1 glutamate--tRNA ligase [Alkalilimnicola ehrlichii]